MKEAAEKILKSQELTKETERMCDVKKSIPEIIGTTGTISQSFRKYLNNILREHKIEELQVTGILR
jgi:hypothetical protein